MLAVGCLVILPASIKNRLADLPVGRHHGGAHRCVDLPLGLDHIAPDRGRRPPAGGYPEDFPVSSIKLSFPAEINFDPLRQTNASYNPAARPELG